MSDLDRDLKQVLIRVRDDHATSPVAARDTILRKGRTRRGLKFAGALIAALASVTLLATVVPAQLSEKEAGPLPAAAGEARMTETIDINGVFLDALGADESSLWFAGAVSDTPGHMSLARLDTSTNEVIDAEEPVTSDLPISGMAIGDEGIWISSWEGDARGGSAKGEVQLIDPESMTEIADLEVEGEAPYEVTIGDDGSTWVVNSTSDEAWVVEAKGADVEIVHRIPVGEFPVDVVAAAGGAWVSNSNSDTITEINAVAGEAIAEFPVNCPGDLIVAYGDLWITSFCNDVITRFDLDAAEVVAEIATGDGPTALVASGGYVWVANANDQSVAQIDPETDVVAGRVQVEGAPDAIMPSVSIVASGGAVWVGNDDAMTISRIDFEPQPDPEFEPLPTPQAEGDESEDGGRVTQAHFGLDPPPECELSFTVMDVETKTLADGKHFGYLKNLSSGSHPSMEFDLAEMLTGGEATRAAREDGVIGPDEAVPNDYYISNREKEKLLVAPDHDTEVILATWDTESIPTPSRATYGDLACIFGNDQELGESVRHNPFWLTVRDGRIALIEEQYLP